MSARRKPRQTLGELQPPAGLRSLREQSRILFIDIARELEPKIDQTLLALCEPDQATVEPGVLAQWADRFNLRYPWFLERAARVLKERHEAMIMRSDWRLDVAWRTVDPVIGKSGSVAYFAPGHVGDCRRTSRHAPVRQGRLRAVHNRAERTVIVTERHTWKLTVSLDEWQYPQAWSGGAGSYVDYVHSAIEPELERYRRHVLAQLEKRGWKRPPEFNSRETFVWLARRVVNRKSAYAIAKDLPPGDNRHRSGIDAQTVKLARYLKLKIPRSVRPTPR